MANNSNTNNNLPKSQIEFVNLLKNAQNFAWKVYFFHNVMIDNLLHMHIHISPGKEVAATAESLYFHPLFTLDELSAVLYST